MMVYDPASDRFVDEDQKKRQMQQAVQERAQGKDDKKTNIGSGNKSWLSSLISELGGAGGAAGGAALGTALLPGVGTVLGAIAGGFLGGTGGRVVENKVRDNRIGLGDALKEGALTGVFGGLGEGYQLLKGARAASKLANLGIKDATAGASKTGLIENLGASLKKGAGGYGVGATAKGEEQLTATGSKQIDAILSKLKVPAGSPEARATALGQRLSAIGDELTGAYSKGLTKLSPEDSAQLSDNILNRILTHPDIAPNLTDSTEKAVLEKLKLLASADDTSKLWQFTRDIENKGINFNLGADSKLVDKEAINRIFRDEIRGTLNSKVPAVQDLNSLYSHGKSAEKFLLNSAKDVKGGNIITKLSNLSPVRSAESKGGALIEKIGKATAGTADGTISGPASRVIRELKIQAPGDMFRASTTPQPTNLDSTVGTNPNDLLTGGAVDPASAGIPGMGSSPTMSGGDQQINVGGQSVPLSYFTPEIIQQMITEDIQKTGGSNIDTIGKIVSIQDALTKQQQSRNGSSKSNIGKVSSQNFSNAQSGLDSLQQFAQLLQSDPSALSKSATPGGSLPIVGGYIRNAAGVGQFDALAYNVADTLLRLRTGAQANPSEIKATATKLMPRAGDSPATVQTKLQTLYSAFNSIIQQGQQGGVGEEDILSQLNGGSGQSQFDPFSQLGYAQ